MQDKKNLEHSVLVEEFERIYATFNDKDPNYDVITSFKNSIRTAAPEIDYATGNIFFLDQEIKAICEYMKSPNSIDSLLSLRKTLVLNNESVLTEIHDSQPTLKRRLIDLLIQLEKSDLSGVKHDVYNTVKLRLADPYISEAEYVYLHRSLNKIIEIERYENDSTITTCSNRKTSSTSFRNQYLSELKDEQLPGFLSKVYSIVFPNTDATNDKHVNKLTDAIYHFAMAVVSFPYIVRPETYEYHMEQFNSIVHEMGLFTTESQENVSKAIQNYANSYGVQ